ncbi:MAG: hypothetical protein ABI887_03560 [Burkholderiales bacterium]
MVNADPVLLIGNSLALLVAANELARRRRAVTLLTDGKPLGGHFAGMQIEGHAFDIGMVMLEKPLREAGEATPADYRPETRNDWTRFSAEVHDWFDAQLPLRRTPTPTVQVEGRRGPDYLIANRLDLLRDAAAATPSPLPRSDPRHAVHKTTGSTYDTLSYAGAAAVNHSDDWHARYVEPYVRKLLGVSSGDFLARFHRTGWVPLYYPETLGAALRGEPTPLSEYPFFTTETGFVGALVAQLAGALSRSSQVSLVTQPLHSLGRSDAHWQARGDAGPWTSTRLALGLPVERCHTLLGLPVTEPSAAASVAIMFCLVRASGTGHPIGCHMIVDDEHATYRLSDQDALAGRDPEWHRVVVEASPLRLAQLAATPSVEDAQTVLKTELVSLMALHDADCVRVLKFMVARNALVIPNAAAVARAATSHARLREAAPGATLTGALLPYGAASFNDQIVQGLQIAKDMT